MRRKQSRVGNSGGAHVNYWYACNITGKWSLRVSPRGMVITIHPYAKYNRLSLSGNFGKYTESHQ
jgi:hypothetical protein